MATVTMQGYTVHVPDEPLYPPYQWVKQPTMSDEWMKKETASIYSTKHLGSFMTVKLCPICSSVYVALDNDDPCPVCKEKKKVIPHIYFADAPLTMGLVRMITDAISAVFQSKHASKVIYLEDLNFEGDPQ